MPKIANVKLSWTRSPSADVASRKIVITKNGEETTLEFGPEVSDYTLDVPAMGSLQFKTIVLDSEGKTATSETYSFTLGDLEDPVPDTNLFHEILSVRDEGTPPISGGGRRSKAAE